MIKRTVRTSPVKTNICESCIHFTHLILDTPTKKNIVKTFGKCEKLALLIDKNEPPKCKGIYFKHHFDVYPF